MDDKITPPVELRRRGRPARAGRAGETAQVQSLARALTLLELVSEREHGAALTELARAAKLAPSTAHRLLKSLELMRYVRQDQDRGLWFIGVQAFTVGNGFARGRDIVAVARPIMRELMQEVGESVNLAILDEGEVVYLSQIECHQMMRAHAMPGGRAPLHCSGVAKALLASLPEAEAEALLGRRPLSRRTERTLTTLKQLRAELRQVRGQGYAVDDEEQNLGMRCVAAAIFDENGEAVAAISMTGPSARIARARLAEFGAIVRRAAAAATNAYGGRSPE